MNKRRFRIFPWLFPMVGAALGFFLPLLYLYGIIETWHAIGNPGEPIQTILGVSNRSIAVQTISDAVYVLDFDYGRESSYPQENGWKPAKKETLELNSPWEIGSDYFHPLQPLILQKQVYIVNHPMIEGVSQARFAVSQHGDLYMWKFSIGGMEGLLRYVGAFLGFLAGSVLFGIHILGEWFDRKSAKPR